MSQRTTETGVRIAMGATGGRVVRQIVKEALIIASAGLTLAWVIAAMVELHLFSGGPGAWTVLVAVPVLLFVVAAFSSWWRARRATLVDPIAAQAGVAGVTALDLARRLRGGARAPLG